MGLVSVQVPEWDGTLLTEKSARAEVKEVEGSTALIEFIPNGGSGVIVSISDLAQALESIQLMLR